MITREQLIAERDRLEVLEEELARNIKVAPEGSVYFRKEANRTSKPYRTCNVDGKRKREALKTKDKGMIKLLKYKRYSLSLIRLVRANIDILKRAERYNDIVPRMITEKLGPEFAECEETLFGTRSGRVVNQAFEDLQERQNPLYPEEMKVHTELGDFRSKTESLIAIILTMLNIQFKYEAPLWVGYGYIYPDFTILHPITGKIVYLEHFGLQESEEYREKMAKRIALYSSLGIFLGSQLIVTCESSSEGLDMVAIKRLLEAFFS